MLAMVFRNTCVTEVTLIVISHTISNFVLTGSSNALLDLTGLDYSSSAQPFSEFPCQTQELGISLLDDELMSLGR